MTIPVRAETQDLERFEAGLAHVRDRWNSIRVRHLEIWPGGDAVHLFVRVRAVIHLGELVPADVRIDARQAASLDDEARWYTADWPIRMSASQSYRNGSFVFEARLPRATFDRMTAMAVRVRPAASELTAECTPLGQTFLLAGLR